MSTMRKIHLTECKRKPKFDTVDIRLCRL